MSSQFKKAMLAVAVTAIAGGANAGPTFDLGVNSIYYSNYENQYRSAESCEANGGCLTDVETGAAGWYLVDITIPGNVLQGDVFAGVIRVQNIDHGSGSDPWNQTTKDQFTGYFAQEVVSTGNIALNTDQIVLTNPSTDPFGLLASGEMFRLYTQSGPGTTIFGDNTGGSVQDIIDKAIDGTFWGSLGITAGDDGGFTYTLDNLAVPGTQTKNESFLALNLITEGPSYNAGDLALINDINEELEGGITAAQLCTAADIAGPAICTQFIASSEIELSNFGIRYGTATGAQSPFDFKSNDPATIERVQGTPEPGTLLLLGAGLLGLAGFRRRSI